jgi:hypothetical protein
MCPFNRNAFSIVGSASLITKSTAFFLWSLSVFLNIGKQIEAKEDDFWEMRSFSQQNPIDTSCHTVLDLIGVTVFS